jgi:hypothetical protein
MATTKQVAVPAGGAVPNIFAIGVTADGNEIAIMKPPPPLITKEEARNMAAHLVVFSGGLEEFAPVLIALEES